MNDPAYQEYLAPLARRAQELRVPMSHTPRDEEFMPVLAYRVDMEIVRAEERIAALRALRAQFTA